MAESTTSDLRLNSIKPAEGSKRDRKRVGRGIGSGNGKTAGRGHKGQKSRSGGFHKTGFEGGQMPLQRRVPKTGFHSRKARYTAEVRLYQLASVDGDVIDLEVLKKARIVPAYVRKAKVINRGDVDRKWTLKGIGETLLITKGAREVIEKAGGKVEE